MKENDPNEMKTIVLRDIEPVIQQKLGDDVIVENFTSTSLLPPGENYGSTILKVDVNIKYRSTGKKKDIHLIAKMMPPTEFQRRIFNSSRTFKKEIFMYETIMPAYNKIELEAGMKPSETFDFLPKFYGYRMSLQPDVKIDDDAVFLMENLKASDYYHGDRSIGYDMEHSKLAILALARFHALGMAVKQKKPGLFEVFKRQARNVQLNDTSPNVFDLVKKSIREDPEMSVYYNRCTKAFHDIGFESFWSDVPKEPWMTITHSDFWVNNVLFHRNKQGQLDDVKFIDFQIYAYCSSLRDLLLFLFSSVDVTVSEEQLESLMDLYYDTLLERLNQLECETKDFSKQGYREKMKEDAYREIVHLVFMIKVLTIDVKECDFGIDKMQSVIHEYKGSTAYFEKLRRMVLYFGKHDWLPEVDETPVPQTTETETTPQTS